MSFYGYIHLAGLAVCFCWAAWAGWDRSASFAATQGAYFLSCAAGFGLGYFVRSIWDLVDLLGLRG